MKENMNQKAEKPVSKREQKRCSILSAAANLFMCKGYNCTSMDHIAQDAGVAKQTIYSNFENKQQLFLGVMNMYCDQKYNVLRQAYEKDDVVTTMTNFCNAFVDLVSCEEATAIRRILWAETPTQPELSEMFYDSGPRSSQNELVDYLNHQKNKGRINCDCDEVAFLLINCLAADYMMADMISQKPVRSKEQVVKSTMKMFKSMCGLS